MSTKRTRSATLGADKQPGRNTPCPCGSDRKYKKCCGKTAALLTHAPVRKRRLSAAGADSGSFADCIKHGVAEALMSAGNEAKYVWAYLKIGVYITDRTAGFHLPEHRERWRTAVEEFDSLSDEEKAEFVSKFSVRDSDVN